MRALAGAVIPVLVLLSACSEGVPTGLQTLDSSDRVSSARAASNDACVSPATVTVSTQAQLLAAVVAASPGDVIAISGTIPMLQPAVVLTNNVTLTCAQPGDGLARGTGSTAPDLIRVFAAHVTIQGLALDARGLAQAVFANRNHTTLNARSLRFVRNNVRCGGACVFFVGVDSADISDNHFLTEILSPDAGSGIHLQRAILAAGDLHTDGTRIERNTMVATMPFGSPIFGAVRPRDGRGLVIRDNIVTGPWSNGMATANLHGSVVENNRIEDARQYALFLGANPVGTPPSSGSLFRRNELSSTGQHALFAALACGNVFVANRISAPNGLSDVFLGATTGDNMLLGHPTVSIDNGTADCDGDGSPDPNFLSGGGRSGAEPGSVIGPVMSHAGEVIKQ